MKFLSDYFNSGTVKQQNRKRFGALLICITAALLAVALIALMIASIATAVKRKSPQAEEPEDTAGSGIPSGYTTTTFDQAQLSSGNLLLIDETHTYTGTPTVVLMNSTRPADTASGEYLYWMYDTVNFALTEDALAAFHQLVTDFHAESGDNNLYVKDAFNQSSATQASALHQTGTALTLLYYTYEGSTDEKPTGKQSIYNVDTYKWLYDHAHEYGFIQASSAEGEENIFRYVGVAHASYMKNNSKTLAEYLDILQTRTASRPLSVQVTVKNADGQSTSVTYNIYRLTSEETPVVPAKFSYTVSGDNMGGYIVTVDRSSATANP